jgi:hypothetical protein
MSCQKSSQLASGKLLLQSLAPMHADTVNVESSLANVDTHYLCCFHLCTLRFGHDARVNNKGGDGAIPLLDEAIFHWFGRPDEIQLHLVCIGPRV